MQSQHQQAQKKVVSGKNLTGNASQASFTDVRLEKVAASVGSRGEQTSLSRLNRAAGMTGSVLTFVGNVGQTVSSTAQWVSAQDSTRKALSHLRQTFSLAPLPALSTKQAVEKKPSEVLLEMNRKQEAPGQHQQSHSRNRRS
jgi:hypothetical protein